MSEEQKGGSADRQELHTTSEHQTEHKIEKQETPGGDKKTQKPSPKFNWKSKKTLLFAAVAAVVILGGVAAYFVYFRDTVYQGFKKEFKASGQPVSIEMELDSENVSILHTDKTGGLLSKGDISLEVPEDALPGRESIVATKITNLKGLPEGWEFVDGYNFTPDGTTFAKPPSSPTTARTPPTSTPSRLKTAA